MRGGSRVGAGRKPGEASIRVRVPVGVLHEVESIVLAYKQHGLKPKAESLKDGPEIKEAECLKDGPEITIQADDVSHASHVNLETAKHLILTDELKAERRKLEQLPKAAQRKIRAFHGTLTQAVLDGVRAYGHRAILFEAS